VALLTEITVSLCIKNQPVETIYFGGGTPYCLLKVEQPDGYPGGVTLQGVEIANESNRMAVGSVSAYSLSVKRTFAG
jgi:hypothetical protein